VNEPNWKIYVAQIPYSKTENFWVSFESDPGLKKTKANIYDRCLPCIQNLYYQLKAGQDPIELGNAYNCWKVTATVNGIDKCLALIHEFEKNFPDGHVYGKFGSSRPGSDTKVVVFHTETERERDRIKTALTRCLSLINQNGPVHISRACAVLFDDILGNWQDWQPKTPIKYPHNVKMHLEKIKRILYRSKM